MLKNGELETSPGKSK